ncbi:MAG: hypothetical protein EOP47_26980 [Sphingobacteriaceae bacterium]|nr:MAG: hypothetical protein EOP47_26980 [Sphingobacteriaceae bacterium]
MNINKILTRVFAYIKALFKGIPADVRSAIHIGVVVTENLKNFINSPAADALTFIIPGNIDDNIKNLLRLKLPLILLQLKLADEMSNGNEIIKQGIKNLDSLNGDIKNALLHDISVLTAQIVSKNELKWQDAVYMVEWYYQKQYKPGRMA